MPSLRATTVLSYLPAACLLAGICLLLPNWPDMHLLLPDQALHEAGVVRLLQLLLIIPLAASLIVSLLTRRFLLWPWLWLGSIALLGQRPALDLIPQLLSLALELCLLLAFIVGESLYIAWRPGFSGRRARLAMLGLALLLVWIPATAVLLPDNPAWRGLLLLPACLLVLLHCLLGLNRERWLPGLRKFTARLPGRGQLRLPQLRRKKFSLSQLSLPRLRMLLRRPEPEPVTRERPMLSLEEGYLVRHPAILGKQHERRIS